MMPEQFQPENILFLDTKKNVIIDGNFTKLIYSDANAVLNAIYLSFPIQRLTMNPSLNFVSFAMTAPYNVALIKNMARIEHDILKLYQAYCGIAKQVCSSLWTQLSKGHFKVYHTQQVHHTPPQENSRYILKISGVWETHHQVGITFKFIRGTRVPF